MKKKPSWVKMVMIITVSSILVLFSLIIIFLSPLTKYLLEKHDQRLIGRELTMDWAYVNPFTGYAHFNDIKIYEPPGDSLFFSADGVSINVNLRQLLSHTIELTQITVDHPWGKIVQHNDTLNFDDLIKRFIPDRLHPTTGGWRFSFLDTKIIDGEFHYLEKVIPINYFVRNVNIESTGKKWSADTISSTFSFQDGKNEGVMKGNFAINVSNLDYQLRADVHDFDMEIIRQYIWELINYGMFEATLDASIQAIGNFNSKDSISIKGRMAVRDFHLGKTTEDDYLSFKELVVVIENVSPIHRKYLFDSITLSDLYLKYEIYDSLNNIEAMFGKAGQNISDITLQPGRFNLVIEVARYVEVLSRNFINSDYKIGQLGIYRADLVFNDYSLAEKFSVEATPLTIIADSVDKNHKRVNVYFTTAFKPYGEAKLAVSINPKDSSDFDLSFTVEKVPASVFNPYFITYNSFPLDRGTIELNGIWTVRNGQIKSTNHVVLIDPRLTKRIRNVDTRWMPMPLIMAFIREQGNVIDYNIPITGNLKDPNFHVIDILSDVVKNIFVKPVTTLYRMEVKKLENEIEKSLTVKWDMRQAQLRPHQQQFVKKIAHFLKDNPTATLNVQPIEFASKEGEYILFYETKKKYFLFSKGRNSSDFSKEDSMAVNMMSVRDPRLVNYISTNLSDTVMFTLHEKCINYVGIKIVNEQMNQLIKSREASFREPFLANGTEGKILIQAIQNDIPYNGFSYFQLDYPGEIPRTLQKAYEKMDDLNNEKPRKQYMNRRENDEEVAKELIKQK